MLVKSLRFQKRKSANDKSSRDYHIFIHLHLDLGENSLLGQLLQQSVEQKPTLDPGALRTLALSILCGILARIGSLHDVRSGNAARTVEPHARRFMGQAGIRDFL